MADDDTAMISVGHVTGETLADRPNEDTSYDFDIAVSFAGEDREFVEAFVAGVKAAGHRVFYDAEHATEMWGADLVEFFDDVFRKRSRFAVVFVSHHYAEKMWTRYERRSALARGLEQPDPYVLPVRLDDTALPGLLPTVGYLDARQSGIDGAVNAAIAKITSEPLSSPPRVARVPRTEVERQRLLVERPPMWEYLLFAAELLHRITSLEPKYRDHQLRFATRTGEMVGDLAAYVRNSMADATRMVDSLMAMMDQGIQQAAFGAPGVEGDGALIQHLAARWTSIYDGWLDWAARHRAVTAPRQYHHVLDLLAAFLDTPIEEYRAFVYDLVAKTDWGVAALAAEGTGPVEIRCVLSLTIPESAGKTLNRELRRLR